MSTDTYLQSYAYFIETVSSKMENIIIIFYVTINLRAIAELIRRTVIFCLEMQDTLSDQKQQDDKANILRLCFFEVFIWFETLRRPIHCLQH
jgi:hypothetical protein